MRRKGLNKIFWYNLVVGKPLPNCTVSHAQYTRRIGNKKSFGYEVEVNYNRTSNMKGISAEDLHQLKRLGFDIRSSKFDEVRYLFEDITNPFTFRNEFFWTMAVLNELDVPLLGSFHVNIKSAPPLQRIVRRDSFSDFGYSIPHSKSMYPFTKCASVLNLDRETMKDKSRKFTGVRWENKCGPNSITSTELFCKMLCALAVKVVDVNMESGRVHIDYTFSFRLAHFFDTNVVPDFRTSTCEEYISESMKYNAINHSSVFHKITCNGVQYKSFS